VDFPLERMEANKSSNMEVTNQRKNMNSQNIVVWTYSRGAFAYAKRLVLSAPGKSLLVLAVIIGFLSIPLLTRADDAGDHNKKGTLTGNWMVTVTPTAPAGPSFVTLVSYLGDGNMLQESSGASIRTAGHGSWDRVGHHQFTQAFVFFRFDAARIYLGTRVVNSTITLSEDGRQYIADSVGQNFDSAGNLLATSQVTEVAQRLF
jgi:hypothetical protein